MRSYGVPRILDFEWPDCADNALRGAKTRAAGKTGPGGTRRAGLRSGSKRRTRRLWKKLARRQGKDLCVREEK